MTSSACTQKGDGNQTTALLKGELLLQCDVQADATRAVGTVLAGHVVLQHVWDSGKDLGVCEVFHGHLV